MASSPNPFCTLGLSVWNRSKKTSFLAPQFWEPNPDAVPQLFCREIILAEQVEVPPGNRRAVGRRVEKRLAALGIRDLFQLLRQIEIIPADNAVPSRGLPTETALVKRCTCSIRSICFSMACRSTGSSIT